MNLFAGQVVVIDWRDALPKEPNKRRPGIVVEDSALFETNHPTAIVVPLSSRTDMAWPDLTVPLPPISRNGLSAQSHALCHLVTAVSKRRVTPTDGRISPAELAEIRRAIALAIGLDEVP